MGSVVGKPASGAVRAMRVLTSVLFGGTQLLRRPPKPSVAPVGHRYGDDAAENLEYLPAGGSGTPRAPLVYVHGGGWIAGKKEAYTRYLTFLTEAGYPVFNLEYPLAPENPHPGQLQSLLRALDFVAAHEACGDGVHLMGDSAGGNLVMMLGLLLANPGLLAEVDPKRGAVVPIGCHSVVSLYGVLDRLSWVEDGFGGAELMLECYGGKGALEATVGPEAAITPMDLEFEAAPPTFLAVGQDDELCRSSQIFAARLAAGPGKLVHKEYPGEGHGFFNLGRTKSDEALRADVLEFLNSQG